MTIAGGQRPCTCLSTLIPTREEAVPPYRPQPLTLPIATAETDADTPVCCERKDTSTRRGHKMRPWAMRRTMSSPQQREEPHEAAAAAASAGKKDHNNEQQQQRPHYRRIWIGGTSGLARTYMNAFQVPPSYHGFGGRNPLGLLDRDERWLLLGHQKAPPAWLAEFGGLDYRKIDFCGQENDNEETWRQLIETDCEHVEQVVLSVRPPLVSRETFHQLAKTNQRMIDGLQKFLSMLVERRTSSSKDENKLAASISSSSILHIVHVSSIAAIDHVQEQHLRSEACLPDPTSDSLYHPYDRFKRRCEEILDELVLDHSSSKTATNATSTSTSCQLRVTHVRLGAFFADDPKCIQCNALALQARIGCYLNTRIDCNSARNVSFLLRSILTKAPPEKKIRYFFYTRPLSLISPIPYGEYLLAYRRAYHVQLYLWIPVAVVRFFVKWVHGLVQTYSGLPFLESVDYLLQVTKREHTFDLSLVGAAYPNVAEHEETMEQCFRRRREYLAHCSR